MAVTEIQSPFQQFFTASGDVVNNGTLYIGTAGTDPTVPANQIALYWDAAATISASQPLSVNGGYIQRLGAPARVYAQVDDASMTLKDGSGSTVFYSSSITLQQGVRGDLASATGASLVGFKQNGSGSVLRTVDAKLKDFVSVKDFGATGNGTSDDGLSISTSFNQSPNSRVPSGNYKNQTTAITLPFGKVAEFDSFASIFGSGSVTNNGIFIKKANNPSGQTDWTPVAYSLEGLSVDVGGYGDKQFGTQGTPSGLCGAINIPAGSTIPNHASGISGYAKTSSPTTGAVAIYGESNAGANSTLLWGINTRTQDLGKTVTQIWGAEFDLNVSKAGTFAVGVDVVGGSTAAPNAASPAYRVGPIGTFANPVIPWGRAFFSDDGAATVGLEIGAKAKVGDTGASSKGSQSLDFYWIDGSGSRGRVATLVGDDSGNFLISGGASGKLFGLRPLTATGNVIGMVGDALGFFNSIPTAKQTVSGSRGGNTALTSLITALKNYGLITDSSTA